MKIDDGAAVGGLRAHISQVFPLKKAHWHLQEIHMQNELGELLSLEGHLLFKGYDLSLKFHPPEGRIQLVS